MKTFISWSGGKESSLSCYKAMQDANIEVACFLNMVSEDGEYSRSHGVTLALLQLQAEAIGTPLVQRKTTWDSYEEEFKKAISDFKKIGIQAGIFGDIALQGHKGWVERVCKETGIEPILPLWNAKREELLEEFIRAGFKAKVVATNANFLGEDWLGREINKDFIKKLKKVENIDLCGEKGEYHTYVYDGPIFEHPVKFITGNKILKDAHWFLVLNPQAR